MNIFFKLFRHKPEYAEWDKHYVEVFLELSSFYERISKTKEFDSRDVYYYRGPITTLQGLITNEFLDGERNINDISLEYVSLKKIDDKNQRAIFNSALFFPDNVRNIKDINPYYRFFYYNEDNKLVTIKSVLIAKDAVYFCTK